ncbi:tRNA pseudouridine(13) synthase TruD [Candidatus Woesearchaeota archaeon]|nr:MAG: tRNA pseudouridine(13) synthase TruD [Candidatus Woesearchaeota archaeon]
MIIKQKPSDFIVREVIKLKKENRGKYCYVKLTKENMNTEDAVAKIARILGLRRKDIGYAGSKDKHAVTEQAISIKGVSRERVERLRINNIKIEFLGFGNERISLGSHEGNEFEIIVRDAEPRLKSVKEIPNYFDEQRFSRNNVEIGRLIIKRNFKEAAFMLMNEYKEVKEHLSEQKNDFVGALRKLPEKILKLYIHSYQSWLFNIMLSDYIRKNSQKTRIVPYSLGDFVFPEIRIKNKKLPLIGFQTETNEVMKKEGITNRDFIIREIPNISAEGSERCAFAEVKDFSIEKVKEGYLLKFYLPKGSYATIVAKMVFY